MEPANRENRLNVYGNVALWFLVVVSVCIGLPFWIMGGLTGPPAQSLNVLNGALLAPLALVLCYAAFGSHRLITRLILAALMWAACYSVWLGVRWMGAFGYDTEIHRRDVVQELTRIVLWFAFMLTPLLVLRFILNWRILHHSARDLSRRNISLADAFAVITATALTVGFLVWAKTELQGLFGWPRLLLPGTALAVSALIALPPALTITLRPLLPRQKLWRCVAYVLLLSAVPGDFILLTSGFMEAEFSLGLTAFMTVFATVFVAALSMLPNLDYELRWG
jgi:hypothetical protein